MNQKFLEWEVTDSALSDILSYGYDLVTYVFNQFVQFFDMVYNR